MIITIFLLFIYVYGTIQVLIISLPSGQLTEMTLDPTNVYDTFAFCDSLMAHWSRSHAMIKSTVCFKNSEMSKGVYEARLITKQTKWTFQHMLYLIHGLFWTELIIVCQSRGNPGIFSALSGCAIIVCELRVSPLLSPLLARAFHA